jgi:hypothetical protein
MTIDQITNTVDAFFKSNQKVLFFKGPWGSGKSYFIRDYLKGKKSFVPPLQYFVSVFGLSNLNEVKEAMNAALEIRPSTGSAALKAIQNGLIGVAGATKAMANIPSIGGIPVGAIGSSAFWAIIKRQKSIVVFDDLERGKIGTHEIFGLASSLAENTEAKVIIIFNEDEIKEEEDKKKLNEYREKVVDVELLFKPETSDLVNRFLTDKSLCDSVVAILGAVESSNIRLITKIDATVEKFKKLMMPFKIKLTHEELEHVAKISCFHFLSNERITPETLEGGMFSIMLKRKDKEGTQANELLRKLKLYPSFPLDALTLELVQNGYCEQASIEKHLGKYKNNKIRDDYNGALELAFSSYSDNFATPLETVYANFEVFLDKYADQTDLNQFMACLSSLKEIGYTKSTEGWKERHLALIDKRAKVKEKIAAAQRLLPSEVVSKYIANLEKEPVKVKDPWKLIKTLVDTGSYHPDDSIALNEMSGEEVFVWMRDCKEKRFLADLNQLVERWDDYTPEAKSFCDKVKAAARRIAKTTPLNKQRARILGA